MSHFDYTTSRIQNCWHCGADLADPPPEPPIGTTVRDRHGTLITRRMNGLWGENGMIPMALWVPMYRAHGPLIEESN